MSVLPLRFSQAAFRQIDAADSWWRENRPANPDLFMRELQAALAQIRSFPTIFASLEDARLPGLRRLLIPRSRYFIYWTVSTEAVEILAVWHTSRGRDPKLHDDEAD
jgi:plasmid stabilization system protein ParE